MVRAPSRQKRAIQFVGFIGLRAAIRGPNSLLYILCVAKLRAIESPVLYRILCGRNNRQDSNPLSPLRKELPCFQRWALLSRILLSHRLCQDCSLVLSMSVVRLHTEYIRRMAGCQARFLFVFLALVSYTLSMTLACIQPNGEQLPVEEWVYHGVRNGTVTDPMLVRIVLGAVEVRPFGWRRPWEQA